MDKFGIWVARVFASTTLTLGSYLIAQERIDSSIIE
jgi:hypothetical protein